MPRLITVALAALAVLGCSVTLSCSSAAVPRDSGVSGRVLFGPTCPVEQVGHPCVRAYSARLEVRAHGRVVARGRSRASDGRFRIALRPGRYVLHPVGGNPYPRASDQPFAVHAHRYTQLRVTFDSGIR